MVGVSGSRILNVITLCLFKATLGNAFIAYPSAALLLSAFALRLFAFPLLLCLSVPLCYAFLFIVIARQFAPVYPPDNAHCAAAAPASRVVAAFTPLRWLFPCLLPLVVAQKSQIGGCSRLCRRTIRQQIGEFLPIPPTVY
jgi:hypothetical protein